MPGMTFTTCHTTRRPGLSLAAVCFYPAPMPSFTDQVAEQIKDAMKAKDKVRLTVLRALKTALTNAAIEKSGLGAELEEAESLAVVRRQVKQREDSASQFAAAGRAELAANEEAELAVLREFLPTALTDAQIDELVDQAVAETGATGKAQMGVVMKRVQELANGRADGKVLAQRVAARLG